MHSDLDVCRDIPGYKAILKAVLRTQIQMLVGTGISIRPQDIFCPSLGAEFRPYSPSKKATFFPIPCLFFPIKKSKKKFFFFFFFKTTTLMRKE